MTTNTKIGMILASGFFVIVVIVIQITHGMEIRKLNTEVRDLKIHAELHQKCYQAFSEDVKKINAYLGELETSDNIDKLEFTEVWKSIARMNNNFKALRLGEHLEEKDLCPENEKACKEEDYPYWR
jgi:hypothetical protein